MFSVAFYIFTSRVFPRSLNKWGGGGGGGGIFTNRFLFKNNRPSFSIYMYFGNFCEVDKVLMEGTKS